MTTIKKVRVVAYKDGSIYSIVEYEITLVGYGKRLSPSICRNVIEQAHGLYERGVDSVEIRFP